MNTIQKNKNTSTPQILVIEDDVILQKNITLSLRRAGYQTLGASSAEETKKILKVTPVGLVLLDIFLPDCNGLDLLEEICGSLSGGNVIVMSAQDSFENIDRARRLGAAAFLIKPFMLKQLNEAILEIMKNPHSKTSQFSVISMREKQQH